MTKPNEGQKQCPACGKMFVPQQAHFTQCFDCFRSGGVRGGEPRSVSSSLPQGYLDKGYFGDTSGVLLPQLLTSEAEQVARTLVAADVSMAQLRRYFTMSRSLKDQLDNGEPFVQVANELLSMISNVKAVVGRTQDGRQRERLDNTLMPFIIRNVDAAVHDEVSFLKGFLPHFESVLGFFIYHNSQKGGRRRGP